MHHKRMVELACLLAVTALAGAAEENRQFWASTSFLFRLDEDWTMKIREDFRLRGDAFFEQQNEVLFTFTGMAERLDLGLGFRQVHKADAHHEWQRENRPYVECSVKDVLWGFKWSDRNRLEWRDFEHKEALFRYRNRLKLASRQKVLGWPLKPYLADEVFIQEESGFNRNRIYAGLIWDVNQRLDVDFFIIHQRDKTAHGWDNVLITGIETMFSF